ncbi:type III-B CRISPR module-associated protein Cmr5 [Saccharolobus islandicus]|uniref:CRISPR type III-B/RAMP module-associated protein Cmr5 n=1 Tax=Saccharolobus islandicus (strain L.D.8.5 / Lassen \|nr:type III-B CRISPR module-associated protein Cmr5 [Sulfolobus islandicus]ADB86633.1 CRISPR-associated protein, Cmr5 family [Sulfolobus islandicus L.D.8.5]
MSEFVKFAASIGKKIITANCQIEKDSSKPGLVRRAVDFPSLMLSLGFSPAFTFYISKIEKYENVYKVYQTLKGSSNDNSVICEELQKKESAGYSGYVGILLVTLEKIGKNISISPDVNKLYSALIDLATNVSFKDEKMILPYLNEIKKVLEALPYE